MDGVRWDEYEHGLEERLVALHSRVHRGSYPAQSILTQSLFGYDIDSTMVRLGLMNLMMHGIDEPMIDYKDTLSKSYKDATHPRSIQGFYNAHR